MQPRLLVSLLLIAGASARAAPTKLPPNDAHRKPPLLPSLLAVDVASSITSAALLAPFVAVIDRSIISSAAGTITLTSAMRSNAARLVLTPLAFLTSIEYLWVWGVYSATYLAANTIDTIATHTKQPVALPKFIGTTAANMGSCVAKDAAFARMFGSKAASSVPLVSLGCFAMRDAATVFASFLLPPQLSDLLHRVGGMAPTAALNAAQLASPIGVQALTAPIHLLGLDLYNRNAAEAAKDGVSRLSASVKNYGPVCGARMLRVLPAFGIGGIGNRVLRSKGRTAVMQRCGGQQRG